MQIVMQHVILLKIKFFMMKKFFYFLLKPLY